MPKPATREPAIPPSVFQASKRPNNGAASDSRAATSDTPSGTATPEKTATDSGSTATAAACHAGLPCGANARINQAGALKIVTRRNAVITCAAPKANAFRWGDGE